MRQLHSRVVSSGSQSIQKYTFELPEPVREHQYSLTPIVH